MGELVHRPAGAEFVAPAGGWLFGARLRCAFPDMPIAISVFGNELGASVECEVVDPAWRLPPSGTEFQRLTAMTLNPPPWRIERGPVPPSVVSSFLAEMVALNATGLEDVPVAGFDGWTLVGTIITADGLRATFTAWSPSAPEHERQRAFARRLVDIALATTTLAATHEALAKWTRFL